MISSNGSMTFPIVPTMHVFRYEFGVAISLGWNYYSSGGYHNFMYSMNFWCLLR
jgi:hypothetical protein